MNPSPVAAELAELGEQYNLPVVSFAATSSELSNKLKYPNFMRTIQPERKGLTRVRVIAFIGRKSLIYSHQQKMCGAI